MDWLQALNQSIAESFLCVFFQFNSVHLHFPLYSLAYVFVVVLLGEIQICQQLQSLQLFQAEATFKALSGQNEALNYLTPLEERLWIFSLYALTYLGKR